MDNQKFLKILNGNFQNIPKNKSNQVRIFLSSTFTDTHAERDYLIANIYPKLKNYCKEKYGLDFQVYDMRWGISNEATNSHDTTEICITEIKNCQKFSFGPNFITILSHKYGSRFLPGKIVKDEYETLLKELKDHAEIDASFQYKKENLNEISFSNLLIDCYQLNENEMPARYRLKSLRKLFDFAGEQTISIDNLYKIWIKIEFKLGNILRTLADVLFRKGQFNRAQYERYYVSVTEKEVFNGILDAKNAADNSLFFIREIDDIEESIKENPSLAKRFIDLDEKNDVDLIPKQFLNELKYKKVPAKLPDTNIFKFNVKWDKNNGISLETHQDYIKNFADVFYEQVKMLVDRNYQKKETSSTTTLDKPDTSLLQEVLEHANFCNETAEKFHGRNDLLVKIKDYLLSQMDVPLLVYGNSGCGKTAILAKITSQILSIVPDPDNYSVLLRFLGTTPQTSNIIQTFNSLIYQLARIFQEKLPDKYFGSKIELKSELEDRLSAISKKHPNKKVVIVLDSIDQLSPDDYDLSWIITLLPRNMKFIYSTIPSHSNILDRFNSLFRFVKIENKFENTIEITSLDKNISIEILEDWLAKENRSISNEQWNVLHGMFDTAQLYPLYIKLIYDLISKWTSFYEPDNEFLKCLNIDKSITYLFKILEAKHGIFLFQRSIIYMTLFKNGISECEIEDILSLDDDVLYEVFEYHAPPVRKLPISLWSRIKNSLQGYMVEKEIADTRVIYWYHRRFIEVANAFYVSKMNSESRNNIFSNVIDFYNETWKNKPKPFKYNEYVAKKMKLKSNEAEQIRETTMQPTVFRDQNGNIKYNKRKIGELPAFISQMTTNLAVPLSCDNVFFNYYFLSGLFFCYDYGEITQIVQSLTQNSSYNLSEETKEGLKNIKLFSLILLQASFSLSDYPSSALCQILNRSLQVYNYSKYYTKLIDEYDKYSSAINSLIVPYQYMQSPGDELLFAMDRHVLPITCTAIGGDNDSIVFTLSNKLNIMDIGNITDVANIQIKQTPTKFNFMIVYFMCSFSNLSEIFKNNPGGVVMASDDEILSYSFEYMHSSLKFSNEIVQNLYLISESNLIVNYKNRSYLDIRNFLSLELKTRHEFVKNVKSIVCNTHHKLVNQTTLFKTEKCYLVVLLETNEIIINEVKDQVELIKLKSISPSGFDVVDMKFYFKDEYSFDFFKLYATLSDSSIFNIDFNDEIMSLNVWSKNICLKMIEISRNTELYLGSNKHVYVISPIGGDQRMMEIEGNFDNACIVTDSRIGCMSNGYFSFYTLVRSPTDLNNYFYTLLFSIEAHYDQIKFSFIKDSEMMLSTSLDSKLKVFLLTKLEENDKYKIKFDKNETDVAELTLFDSQYAVCKMKNSNSLNIWKMSTGKIVKKLQVGKSETIEECIADEANQRMIVVSSLNNSLFIAGFSLNINEKGQAKNHDDENKIEFINSFKLEVGKENSFRVIKDNKLNKHLLITESSKEEEITLKIFELDFEQIQKQIHQPKLLKLDYRPFDSSSILENCCTTFASRYLSIFIESHLFVLDINAANLIAQRSFVDQEKNLDYFLSPTNLSATNLTQITPLEKSNDLIALNNLNELTYISINEQKLKLNTNAKLILESFKVHSSYLIGLDGFNQKLMLFDLNQSQIFKCQPENAIYTVNLNSSNYLEYGFSPNCMYFYVIENTLLRLYKRESGQKIGEIPIYLNVTKSVSSNDFICLTLKDNRFITFLIAEPNQVEKIRRLESRNSKLTLNDKIRCDKLFDNAGTLMDSSTEDEELFNDGLRKYLFENEKSKDDKQNEILEKFKRCHTKKKKYIRMNTFTITKDEWTETNWHLKLLKQKLNYKEEDLKASDEKEAQMKKQPSLTRANTLFCAEIEKSIDDQTSGSKSKAEFDRKLKSDLLNSLTNGSTDPNQSKEKKPTFKNQNTGQSVSASNNNSKTCQIT